jgi:hypothetical protein
MRLARYAGSIANSTGPSDDKVNALE